MEMVAWASGMIPAGKKLSASLIRSAIGQHVQHELERGYVVSDVQLFGSEAMILQVFGDEDVEGDVEGVGEVWVTDALDAVEDFQLVWQRAEAAPVAPKRQRTKRR